jgi:hypothetical protein
VLVEPLGDEVELDGSLLDALREIALVEREAKLPVLEHVVRAGLVIPSACGLVLHCGHLGASGVRSARPATS